jgi:hypothetical protein
MMATLFGAGFRRSEVIDLDYGDWAGKGAPDSGPERQRSKGEGGSNRR